MEPFGGDSFVVRSVPASLAQKHIKAQDGPEGTLRAIVEEMVEKTVSRRLLLPADEVLISASCKMAVKAGDPLSFEEMNAWWGICSSRRTRTPARTGGPSSSSCPTVTWTGSSGGRKALSPLSPAASRRPSPAQGRGLGLTQGAPL